MSSLHNSIGSKRNIGFTRPTAKYSWTVRKSIRSPDDPALRAGELFSPAELLKIMGASSVVWEGFLKFWKACRKSSWVHDLSIQRKSLGVKRIYGSSPKISGIPPTLSLSLLGENRIGMVHTERFEVKIPGVTEDEFYPFAIKEGFARACFALELMLQMGSGAAKIKKWISASRSCEVNDE
jgi:hypothetical protein